MLGLKSTPENKITTQQYLSLIIRLPPSPPLTFPSLSCSHANLLIIQPVTRPLLSLSLPRLSTLPQAPGGVSGDSFLLCGGIALTEKIELLTDAQIRRARPTKMSDGGGLHLQLMHSRSMPDRGSRSSPRANPSCGGGRSVSVQAGRGRSAPIPDRSGHLNDAALGVHDLAERFRSRPSWPPSRLAT